MSRSSSTRSDAVRVLQQRALEIRDRELEVALAKLDANGGLSEEQRAEVRALSDRIVRNVVRPLETAIETAPDERTATVLSELFVGEELPDRELDPLRDSDR